MPSVERNCDLCSKAELCSFYRLKETGRTLTGAVFAHLDGHIAGRLQPCSRLTAALSEFFLSLSFEISDSFSVMGTPPIWQSTSNAKAIGIWRYCRSYRCSKTTRM